MKGTYFDNPFEMNESSGLDLMIKKTIAMTLFLHFSLDLIGNQNL